MTLDATVEDRLETAELVIKSLRTQRNDDRERIVMLRCLANQALDLATDYVRHSLKISRQDADDMLDALRLAVNDGCP